MSGENQKDEFPIRWRYVLDQIELTEMCAWARQICGEYGKGWTYESCWNGVYVFSFKNNESADLVAVASYFTGVTDSSQIEDEAPPTVDN